MRFPDEMLDRLRAIYRDEFDTEITRDEAAEIGTRLVKFIQLIRRPLPRGRDDERTAGF